MTTLGQFTGREIGVSGWITIDQQTIDAFADCTGDRQWIHVDVERARRESPYGGTIAHGYLTHRSPRRSRSKRAGYWAMRPR
jgi:acyl dehydratase